MNERKRALCLFVLLIKLQVRNDRVNLIKTNKTHALFLSLFFTFAFFSLHSFFVTLKESKVK